MAPPTDADAIVIALKSRSTPADQAVEDSLQALTALQQTGIERFLFKYCSTFDSTDRGNIGPVTEALMDALGVEQTIFCPAFPENGRSVYQAHLFVHGQLLHESGMEAHPLNPMTDANLTRVLAGQATRPVGHINYQTVRDGPDAIQRNLASLREAGTSLVIIDAMEDRHLHDIGRACAMMPLLTGGSGLAIGLPAVYRDANLIAANPPAPKFPRVNGAAAVIAGSCSTATNRQVAHMKQRHPAFAINPRAAVANDHLVDEAVAWAKPRLPAGPVLVYSSAPGDELDRVHRELGREAAAEAVERVLAQVARRLTDHGVRKLVAAGGETSGAVLRALEIKTLRIGPQIDPGVPWTTSIGPDPMALALKSGNFGGDDFFEKALGLLP